MSRHAKYQRALHKQEVVEQEARQDEYDDLARSLHDQKPCPRPLPSSDELISFEVPDPDRKRRRPQTGKPGSGDSNR